VLPSLHRKHGCPEQLRQPSISASLRDSIGGDVPPVPLTAKRRRHPIVAVSFVTQLAISRFDFSLSILSSSQSQRSPSSPDKMVLVSKNPMGDCGHDVRRNESLCPVVQQQPVSEGILVRPIASPIPLSTLVPWHLRTVAALLASSLHTSPPKMDAAPQL